MNSEKSKKLRKAYLEDFDPKTLQDYFYSKRIEYIDTSLFVTYQAIKNFYGNSWKKVKMLEFGCGPIPIYAGASVASGIPLEIVMSEFLPQNREHLNRWINGEDFQNLEHHFELLAKFSGRSSDEIKASTRKSISKVVSYDLWQDLSADNNKYDVVTSFFCVEVSSTSQEEHEEFLKKIVGLVAKGGLFVMAGLLQNTETYAGQKVVETFPVTEDIMRKLIPKFGLELISNEIIPREDCPEYPCEFSAVFVFSARKTI